MEVTVSLLLWAIAWQLAYSGTRFVSGSASPSYSENRLAVVDLDVAVRVVLAVGLVEVEGAHSAGYRLSRYANEPTATTTEVQYAGSLP